MALRVLALAVAICSITVPSQPATADEPPCVKVGWEAADANCGWTYAEYQESSTAGDSYTWVVSIQCGNGGICTEYVECVENGEAGFMHDVFRDGVDVGDVCVPERYVDRDNIARLVIRAFKQIDWPASQLVVEPPRGKTLVNFATNFYTMDDRPIGQTVTVAGQKVQILARPVSYTFHFGDDSSVTSATPGAPHPDLEITHEYPQTGAVEVRLDTTYAGEYRIGDGDWIAINQTLTVPGEPQDLEILEAIPQLVLR